MQVLGSGLELNQNVTMATGALDFIYFLGFNPSERTAAHKDLNTFSVHHSGFQPCLTVKVFLQLTRCPSHPGAEGYLA